MVEPISQESLPDKIVYALLRRIRSGEWPPGHALPPQRDLARSLNVSMSSLREAISTLMALGFLDATRGKGTFIRNANGYWVVPGDFAGVYFDRPEALSEFIEARTALEATLASLAAQRRSEQDVKVLNEILKLMEKARSDAEEYRLLDGMLHFRVAEMSRNSILEKMYKGLYGLIEEYMRAVPDPTRGFEWHARLVEAIEEGDSDEAKEIMRKSLHVDEELWATLEKQTSSPHTQDLVPDSKQ